MSTPKSLPYTSHGLKAIETENYKLLEMQDNSLGQTRIHNASWTSQEVEHRTNSSTRVVYVAHNRQLKLVFMRIET